MAKLAMTPNHLHPEIYRRSKDRYIHHAIKIPFIGGQIGVDEIPDYKEYL